MDIIIAHLMRRDCERFHASRSSHSLKLDTSVDRTNDFSHPKKRYLQNRIAKSPVYATTTIRHYDVLRENMLKQVIFVRARHGAIDRTCQKLDVSKTRS